MAARSELTDLSVHVPKLVIVAKLVIIAKLILRFLSGQVRWLAMQGSRRCGGICSLSSAQLVCAGMMDGNVKVQAAAINMLNFALAHPDTCTHVFKSAQVSAPEHPVMRLASLSKRVPA